MSKPTYFCELFEMYGDHQTALAMRHIRNCWMPKCDHLRKRQRDMLISTRTKVIGRAYRVYSKIRKLEGF